MNLDELKARLPAYLEKIGVEHVIRGNKLTCRCPLHEDHHPSFEATLKQGAWLFFCHPCNLGGSVIDLHINRTGLDKAAAIAELGAMLGGCGELFSKPLPARKVERVDAPGPKLPDDAAPGNASDHEALAKLRGISPLAPAQAALRGTLYFGNVCGFRSWILTDERRLIAEARRMDGKKFPAVGDLGARKSHSIKGSSKSWPVGLAIRDFTPTDFRAVSLVEGGPDYLAAWHFTLAHDSENLPLAMLGAGADIHPAALELLRGKRVRFFPHIGDGGAGMGAVKRWAGQLAKVGCNFDAFAFEGLTKPDGSAVTDLNDAVGVATPEELLP